ncbi:MAG: hypothetical protein UX18_C0041G0007 [Candidatus Azambacteria bacterium GW2011_GWC2_45_7b]|uniref:Uncharacterized protein n=1 Tax=Candidatus Azambacteria bacterium GW2011_GWC2_45_7b TaxID=1618621 RepID=A0A837IG77_9BACT|nr:MAG: hypothetical protein UX18_C0041G0007 [Candidatus Azambacteria bacterium GW2011_GWC2_45_7b]
MSLTRSQKAKLTVKIKNLTKKADELERKAKTEDDNFYASAITCGGELAGSYGTEYMHEEVKLLRGRVKLLEEVRDGVVVLNDRKHTKTRLAVIQQEMSLLTKEKLKTTFFMSLKRLFFFGPGGIEPPPHPPQGCVLPLYYGPERLTFLYLHILYEFVNLENR